MARNHRSVALTSTVFMTLAAAAAGAQDQTAHAAAPAVGGIEEVVVTARKREESAQDVPVAVAAISAAQIERYDLTSLERVAASIPQLTVGRNSTGSGANITLRGIGSTPTSIGIEQSVATVVDSVYYGQGRIINEGFFDAQRIEVLKGPQALFYGKNATAGVISITTNDPGDEPEALARLGYEFKAKNVLGEGVFSMPVSETFGVRLALRASRMSGGYFKNRAVDDTYNTINAGVVTPHLAPVADSEGPEEKDTMARLTLKWRPSDSLTATLKASASQTEVNTPGWNRAIYKCPSGFNALNPGAVCEREFFFYQNRIPSDIAPTIPVADDDGSLGNKYKAWGVTGTLNYEADAFTLTSVTNYQWNRNRFVCDCDFQQMIATPDVYATENTRWKAFSTELRGLTTFDGPANLMLGLLYQTTDRAFDQYVAQARADNPAAANPAYRYLGVVKNSATDGETIALFGQLMTKFAERWEATAGVRYTHETKDTYFVHPYLSPAMAALYRLNDRITADQTFNNWSPEATLSYKPVDGINLFVAYKTAYKSGGFSNGGNLGNFSLLEDFTFEPEKAKGFEGGIKSTLLDNQLRLNLIGYSYKYNNLQVDFFNSPTFAFITNNAGAATTRGVELELQWAPLAIPDLQMRGTLNYNRARYKDFIAPCYAGMTIAMGCSMRAPAPANTPLQDLSGKRTAMAPTWTGSLGMSYDMPVGSLRLGMTADARYSGSYFASSFAHPNSVQPKYVMVDASLRLHTEDGQWELAVIGKNLSNQFVQTGTIDAPSTGTPAGLATGTLGDQVGLILLPRTVTAQLTWRY